MKSPRSLPAVNTLSLPAITTARTDSSSAAWPKPSASCAYIVAVIAFLRSGRSKFKTTTLS